MSKIKLNQLSTSKVQVKLENQQVISGGYSVADFNNPDFAVNLLNEFRSLTPVNFTFTGFPF